ncbi:MAG: zinc ribbon domain-containing protein [Lentisphaeria bacterium]|jgi:hypothetical protein|nr:zinc ribbon domain-containing protein [Lentisphaeria bacterium]
MIQCPNCGSDNMVNAIFCRQCQKRLNLDEITPDAFDEPEKKTSTATRVATAVIVVVLLAVIGLLLIPVKLPASGASLSDPEKAKADGKFAALQRPNPGRQVSFTNNEATHVATKVLGLPRTGSDQMLPQAISIQFLDGGKVRIVLQHKAFGKVPFCTTVVTKPTVSAPGTMDFSIESASVGMLPFVGPLKARAAEQVSRLFSANFQFTSARVNAASLEIAADKGTYAFPAK